MILFGGGKKVGSLEMEMDFDDGLVVGCILA